MGIRWKASYNHLFRTTTVIFNRGVWWEIVIDSFKKLAERAPREEILEQVHAATSGSDRHSYTFRECNVTSRTVMVRNLTRGWKGTPFIPRFCTS
jgi:hypothetical protein